MIKIIKYLYAISIITLISACSGGKTPILPGETSLIYERFDTMGVYVSDIDDSGAITGGHGTLGLFEVHVDTENLHGEIIPVRGASQADYFEIVDITNFMTLQPCIDCVRLASIGLDYQNRLVLSIGIKHPFDAGDPDTAITGRNRADLHLFNVEGIVVASGGGTFEFEGLDETISTIYLFNADGYTKYLTQSLNEIFPTDATIHPYITHFDDYGVGNFDAENEMGFESVTVPLPSGNLVMPMGSDYDYKDYVFAMPVGTSMSFIFAVGASYGVSAYSLTERFNPVYKVPQFNKKAASRINTSVKEWDYVPGDTDSSITLNIHVLDINHGVETGDELDQMKHDSSVGEIIIDVPELLLEPLVIENPVPVDGDGRDPLNPLTFEATLINTAGGNLNNYPALVKVVDSYPVNSDVAGLSRIDPVTGSINDAIFQIDEFATYCAFILHEPSDEPICVINTTPQDTRIEQGTLIVFDGSSSMSDGVIDTYQWDFSYDGVTFNIDAEGAIVNGYICEPGVHDVALRIIDEDLIQSICTVRVTVEADDSPIDGWGEDVKIDLGGDFPEMNITNTANRAIVTYQSNLYVVMNSNVPPGDSENIYFIKSQDMGITWEPAVMVTNYPADIEAWTREANLVADKNTGNIYIHFQSDALSYIETTAYRFDVFVVYSEDDGLTWSEPIRVNDDTIGNSHQRAGSIAIDDSVEPSRLYIAYENRATASDLNIHVATTTSDTIESWSVSGKIDDDARGSIHPSIYAHPVDKSVCVAWVDAKNTGGMGRILFDRSTDQGQTWGEDIIIHTINVNNGPFETCMAIDPTSGKPGVMWREVSTTLNKCTHRFAMSLDSEGMFWSEPVDLSGGETRFCWAGTLDVTTDGRWVAVFEQDHEWTEDWRGMFVESSDGETWTTPVQIDDESAIFGISMVVDDCNVVHCIWADDRDPLTKNELYYDKGS